MIFEHDRWSLIGILAQPVSSMSLNKDTYYFHFFFKFLASLSLKTAYLALLRCQRLISKEKNKKKNVCFCCAIQKPDMEDWPVARQIPINLSFKALLWHPCLSLPLTQSMQQKSLRFLKHKYQSAKALSLKLCFVEVCAGSVHQTALWVLLLAASR